VSNVVNQYADPNLLDAAPKSAALVRYPKNREFHGMANSPRIAVGCFQQKADHRLAAWSLMALLAHSDLDVQPYLPQSHFCHSAAAQATGHDQRHLDTWQMPQTVCREILTSISSHCDLAVVEGRFKDERQGGGSLERLCRWLEIPRIAVLDTRSEMGCQTPRSLSSFDGVILDHVQDERTAGRWSVEIESLSGTPVLGWLPPLDALRSTLDLVARGANASLRFCDALAAAVKPRFRSDRFLQIAQNAPDMAEPQETDRDGNPSTIALAYDEAFQRYFPDTLDRMEAAGARIRTFSPLRAEALPSDADVVVIGCGNLEPHAEQLARNRCMHQALAEHKRAGKRIYAEGAGAAYLCRNLILPSGRRFEMSGLIQANAERRMVSEAIQPVEQRWRSPLWIGGSSTCVRGYRNRSWRFSLAEEPEPYENLEQSDLADVIGGAQGQQTSVACRRRTLDTLMDANVIASRVHVNFAAHPGLLNDFVRRSCPAVCR
jgi:cobyrinic acid a,c-diamide synthase